MIAVTVTMGRPALSTACQVVQQPRVKRFIWYSAAAGVSLPVSQQGPTQASNYSIFW